MRKLVWTASLCLAWCSAALAYTDLGNRVYRSNGSSADTQAAINAAVDGYVVEIPDGTYTWSSGVSISGKGVSLRGSRKESVILAGTAAPKVRLNKDATHVVELSGISFIGSTLNEVEVGGGWAEKPFVIHDCSFTSSGSRAIRVAPNGGLIYKCDFKGGGNYNDEAIQHKDDSDSDRSWGTADTVGSHDTTGSKNLYVEDCTFTNMIYQAMDFDGASRIVVRYCIFSDSAMTSHGADTGPIGMRHAEIYKCNFVFHNFGDCDGHLTPPLDYFVFIRGGTGCIYSNIFSDLTSCAWGVKNEVKLTVQSISRQSQIPCQTTWPAYRQIGVGFDGTSYITDPLYLWANSASTDVGRVTYTPDECGLGQTIDTFLKVNRDFYLSARPNYTGYPYPHPLRSEAAKPATPQNLRVVGP